MFFAKFFALFSVAALVMVSTMVNAMDKGEDTIILGGSHGCGPKLLLKSGGKKKGDILVMNDCKHKQQAHYIPYPVYHSYGGHGYGGGHGGYGGY